MRLHLPALRLSEESLEVRAQLNKLEELQEQRERTASDAATAELKKQKETNQAIIAGIDQVLQAS